MGIEMLARLLEETAAEVPAPALAEAAWEGARRVRRRRRVVAGVAAATAAAAVAAGTALAVGAAPWATPPPSGGTPGVTVIPSAPAVDKLPAEPADREDAPLPRTLPTAGAKRITASPLSRAVALYQPNPGQTEKLTQVYALGWDGALRWLDEPVKLDFTRDADGRTVSPVLATSLSPDGRRAVFPQHEAVAIVDLTTGKADTFKVPGWNGYVGWRGNSTVLVGQAHASYTVDLATRAVEPLPAGFAAQDVAVDPTGTAPLVKLPANIDQSRLGGYRIKGWQGTAWRSGDLVVRAGTGTRPDSRTTAIVGVVNVKTGVVVRLLAAAATTLGWLDNQTVLLQTPRQGIVAWDIRNGRATSVSAPFDGTVAVSPT
jgi:hypothetical protein